MTKTLSVRTRREGALVLGLVMAVAACERIDRKSSGGDAATRTARTWTPTASPTIAGVALDSVKGAITARLAGAHPQGIDDEQWTHATRLYRAFDGSPLWLDEKGLRKDRGEPLMRAIVDATDDGIDLDSYPIDDVVRTVTALRGREHATAEQLADADVMLTTAFVALGEDLLSGQTSPKTLSQDWHVSAKDELADSTLALMLRSDQLDQGINEMRPADSTYAALRKELVHYRQLAAGTPWTVVPEGKALKRGESDKPERLAALRARLAAEGYIDSTATASPDSTTSRGTTLARYDETLAGSVAAFQARHAIGVDSILGKETVDALNVPVTFRLGQIAANLERYRWMPRALGARYVLVNVPAFTLAAYDDGKPPLEMKVIVGADYADKQTPVFSDSMETVVFRPYWNVTDSIATKEIWPKVQSDPGYMDRNNYETYTENGKQRIRQKPGDKNSLGLVKFLFPNDFNIYLHDTPEDGLFKKDVRAFSHGCIRVEKPAELAQWALGWDADKVQQAMHGTDNRSVKLPTKIPVYIAYFTTYTRDGQLYFGNDLYGRDSALVERIASGATLTPRVDSAVAALKGYLGT